MIKTDHFEHRRFKNEPEIKFSFGTMNAEILIHKTGQDLMIGFNPKFLSDALRIIDDEEVTLYMMNAKSPCFIKDEGRKLYLSDPSGKL